MCIQIDKRFDWLNHVIALETNFDTNTRREK
jgi:hypothetical protein